jgi:hypothetical protein
MISGAGLAFGLTRPSILVLLCAGVVMHLGIAIAQAASRVHEWDFSHYYVAAFAMRTGLNPYAMDLQPLGRQLGLDGIARATDTPFFLLCFEPITWLGPTGAYWVWFAINAVSLALAMFLILRAVPKPNSQGHLTPRLNRRELISLCAIVLIYPPLSNHIFFAQAQIPVLLLIVVAMRCLEGARDRTAGLVLAVATLLKVFPIVMAGYLIVCRKWRALGWMGVGLVAGVATTAFAFGLGRIESFVGATYFTRSPGFLARPANVALGSFVSRMFWYANGDVTMSQWLDWTRTITMLAVQISLLGLTIFATLPRADMSQAKSRTVEWESRKYALWVVTAIMLSPTAWIHYMVLLILPIMLVASAGWGGSASPRTLWLMAASYALISLSMAIAGSAQDSLAQRPYLKTALEECATLSLVLAYASAWYFAVDSPVEVE